MSGEVSIFEGHENTMVDGELVPILTAKGVAGYMVYSAELKKLIKLDYAGFIISRDEKYFGTDAIAIGGKS